MHWKWVLLSTAWALGACDGGQAGETGGAVTAASQTAEVAWNERVEVRDGRIPGSPQVRIRVTVGGKPPYETAPVFQTAGKVVFDLPPMPRLPDLPAETLETISPAAYGQVPNLAQQATYSSRGGVLVQFLNVSGQEAFHREYAPYGAVQPGQLTLIGSVAADQCFSLPGGFSVLESQVYPVGQARVCYLTAGFSGQGTAEALTSINITGVSKDKNTLASLDQASANAFDPSCEQTARWLNRIGQRGFSNISSANLIALTNAQTSPTVTGAGVQVYVVGGGLGGGDGFNCPLANMQGHDRHVGEIIRALAPGATIGAKEVCDDAGNCAASSITRALLEIAAEAASTNREMVVNTSLGGPLANAAMFEALKLLETRVLVVASGGNGPYAPRHYPASYSSSLPHPAPVSLTLGNVIAVGASGRMNGNWGIGGFNTRRNGEIAAPGINLCPDTALAFRCKGPGSGALQEIGISGSSFAAPAVAGIAALYLQRTAPVLTPVRLRQCLNNFSRQNPSLDRMVWFNPSGC